MTMSKMVAVPDAVRAMMVRAMTRSLVLVGPALDVASCPCPSRAVLAAGLFHGLPAHVTVFAMARMAGSHAADPFAVTVDWCLRHDRVRVAVVGLPDALNTLRRRPALLGGGTVAARGAMMVVDDALVRASAGLDRGVTLRDAPCDDGCGTGLAIDMRDAWPVRLD